MFILRTDVSAKTSNAPIP